MDLSEFYLVGIMFSHACLRMGHCYTDYIDIKSGVKQGGIMSPQLYNVYVDDVIEKLLSEELSCKIRDIEPIMWSCF